MSSSLTYLKIWLSPFRLKEVVPYEYLMTWRWGGIRDMYLIKIPTALRHIVATTPANDNPSAK